MVKIDEAKCIGCGKCVKDCIAESIQLENQKAVFPKECLMCGHCVAICPTGAVSIPEYDMDDVETYEKECFELEPEVVLHSIKFRRSIRDYVQKPVEQEKLEYILQAGRYTATAKNNQGSHFIFVQKEMDKLKELVWNHIEELIAPYGYKVPRELFPYASFNRRRKKESR